MDLKADKSDTYTKSQVYTKTEVDTIAENIVIEGGGVTPQDLEPKVNRTELADVAFSGSYTNLANTPSIPTKVSDLTNDSGFITSSSIPTTVSSFTNDAGYLTQHQDISGKADKSTTYTKQEVDSKLSSAMHFKGTVANYAALSNVSNPDVGDMYNLLDTGSNYAWDGSVWDKLSENIDLSNYVTVEGLTTLIDAEVDELGLVDSTDLATKQDVLTAGSNITISNNTISATVPDISGKADKSDTYTKSQVYTKTEVDTIIENIPGGGSGGVTQEELQEAIEDFITLDNIQAGNYVTITPDGEGNIVIDSIYSGGNQVDLSNYYTKAEANKAFGQKSSEHTHANKTTILDLFSLDGGVLKWNGNPIPINPTSVESTIDGTYDNQLIFNTGTICTENDIKVISQSVVYMTNPMPATSDLEEGEEDPNTTYIYVYNNDYLLDTIILPPTSTQGYELPIIKTIKIKATGRVSSQLIISGYCY